MFTITEITHAKKIQAQIKELQRQLDAIKKPMKQYMIDNNITEKIVGQYVVTLSSHERTSVSVEKLQELAPAVAKEVIKTTQVNTLNF